MESHAILFLIYADRYKKNIFFLMKYLGMSSFEAYIILYRDCKATKAKDFLPYSETELRKKSQLLKVFYP